MIFNCKICKRDYCNYTACIGDACEYFIRDDYWKRLAMAAIAYINENPCDPDIYPEQWKAWNEYQKLLQERGKHER